MPCLALTAGRTLLVTTALTAAPARHLELSGDLSDRTTESECVCQTQASAAASTHARTHACSLLDIQTRISYADSDLTRQTLTQPAQPCLA